MTYIPDTLSQKNNYVLLYQVDGKVDRNAIKEALAKSNISDENQYEIISFTPSLGRRPDSSDEWESICKEAVQWFLEVKNKLSSSPTQPVFHIFSLAPLPLVIHFGALISSWSKVIPYQYNKSDNSWHPWAGKPDQSEFFQVISRPEDQTAKDVLMFISVTRSVEEEAQKLKLYKKNKRNILIFKAKTVSQESIPSVATAVKAVQEIKIELDQALNKMQGVRCVHLFFAGPMALGFLIGRQINLNVFPNIALYNYFAGQNPSYRNVCQINRDSLTNIRRKFNFAGGHPLITIINFVIAALILTFGLIGINKLIVNEFGKAAWFMFGLVIMITLLTFEMIHQDTFEKFIRRYFLREEA